MFGWTELLIVFGILVLLFGASRIPGVARSLGKSVGAFQEGLEESEDTPEDSPDPSENSTAETDSDSSRE